MDAAAIVASTLSVSDKIRALDKLGYPRAEIARLLGKRYQHVRNVLEADIVSGRARSAVGVAETPTPFEASKAEEPSEDGARRYRLEVGSRGEVVLPPDVMAELQIRPNGFAMAEWRDGALRIISVLDWIRDAQAWAAKYGDPSRSMVDELIAERRAEAAKELSE